MANRTPVRKPASGSRVVAIDIGTESVHAVEVHYAPDPRIVKRGSAALSGPVWEDLGAHRDALALAIKSALSAGGISTSQVVTAIPRRMVTLKYARLPHAEPEQIRSMVRFEAQQYVPFPLEDVVLDHQIVSDESDEMTTVMIVAARLTLVETLLSIFDKAGLEVTHVSVSALALAEHARGAALPVALLEADHGELDLAVVSADKLLFSRAASLQGTGVAGSHADQLTAEMARSLAAYQNEHRSSPVSRVLIAGRASELTDVQQALDGLLDIPVGPLTSPLLPAADPTAATYAVAAGLGLQAAGGGISTIDLVPASRLERKVAVRRRTNTGLALVGVAAAAVLAAVYFSKTMEAQAKTSQEAERWNSRLEAAKKGLTAVNGDWDRVTKQYQATVGGMGRAKPMVDVVKAVSDALPRGGAIYLTQLSFERGSKLSIHGNAANEAAATDLVVSLQGSGAFKDVRLDYLGDSSTDFGASGGAVRRESPQPQPRATAPRTGAGAARPGAGTAGAGTPPTRPGGGPPAGGPFTGAPTPGAGPGGGPGRIAAAPGQPGGSAPAISTAPGFPDMDEEAGDTGSAPGAKAKPAAASMSFLVTCRVLGAEPKDLGDKTKRTTTASLAGARGGQ